MSWEVDFINFMDLEMSRSDKAITLLSGDGGGVIKPIAGDDEEVVWKKKQPWGYEGGIFRARLPEGWLDWHLIATFSIFRARGASIFPPFLCGQGQIKECSIVKYAEVKWKCYVAG